MKLIRHVLCIITAVHRRKLLFGPGAQAPPPLLWSWGSTIWRAPHFCDVILSKLCFNCLHWFYAMLTNRQLEHSFPAVLDIFRKGLNLQAPLKIQWPKCFQLQGGSAPGPRWGLCPQTPVIGSCSPLAMVPPNSFCRLWSSCLEPPPLILTSLRLWLQVHHRKCYQLNLSGSTQRACTDAGVNTSMSASI